MLVTSPRTSLSNGGRVTGKAIARDGREHWAEIAGGWKQSAGLEFQRPRLNK